MHEAALYSEEQLCHFSGQCWVNFWVLRSCFILIRNAFPAHCRDLWCHLRQTWELGDGRVYSTVNHHVWCGLSVRVRGELLAWCSHRDLMRWFSCSNAPSAALCNSEAPTQWLLWPACVTSTFVLIRDVAHNPETCRIAAAEPGTSGLSVSVVCGFSSRLVRDTKKNKKITVWPIFVGYSSNLPSQTGVEFAVHTSYP